MSLTSTQQQAIAARGNVLVVAGAGTGKTRTLVERCLNCLLDEIPPVSLDEILMVTFTDAAAAEMRRRIRARLEEERSRAPEDPRWEEQLALFETAHIGTLHSFCLQLVRQHFYELELDPQLAVIPEEEARLQAEETLDSLLQKYYAGRSRAAEAVQQLIQAQGRGGDKPIRRLLLRLHHYTQTLPDPAQWFRRQLDIFASPDPVLWRQWFLEAVAEARARWLPVLKALAPGNPVAAKAAAALESLPGANADPALLRSGLDGIASAAQDCPRGKKTQWVGPLKTILEEAGFLSSLAAPQNPQASVDGLPSPPPPGAAEPSMAHPQFPALSEDWSWVRGQMTTLLQLAREFTESFSEAKRELGVVDFHDLEQCALRLLWDTQRNQPTLTARQWRKQLRFVFVDEYQDINAAQDKIIEALSREGTQANRFLVGDIKQSIYRFRLANPRIFQGYVETWRDPAGQAIPLVENFRSREGVLNGVNSLFNVLMQRDLGGVPYDEQTRLRFGAPEERRNLSAASDSTPCVELHLRVRGGLEDAEGEEAAETLAQVADLEEADKEARLVALRLRELKQARQPVWDEQTQSFRPVDWSDMAILLRAPSGKSESYAKEFSRLNIPLLVARGGFYASLEISDLLSLLNVLDNPLQDLPLLAVLHSPLVGLTLDELAIIRLAGNKTRFWTALVKWHQQGAPESRGAGPPAEVASSATATVNPSPTSLLAKVTTFLDCFARWRRLARQVSLSRCLEAVLAETHYAAWLLTQPRGPQRHANVQRLVSLAQQFDQFQRQGLYRFLRFIEAQQEAETEPDVPPVSGENSVRLMSIHQSKGLEFPLVVVADLGKPFNVSDLRADVILDEAYGLCPQIQPPHTGKSYPSLPYWLARQRQRREMLGEELRLLYVATTRARDRLILSGSLSKTRLEQLRTPQSPVSTAALMAARSYADWISLWFAAEMAGHPESAAQADATQGELAGWSWTVHDDTALVVQTAATPPPEEPAGPALAAGPETWEQLQQRLEWRYRFVGATRQPAKTSVTAVRRRAAEADEEAVPAIESRARASLGSSAPSHFPPRASRYSSAEIGTAHHVFLQLVSLEQTGSAAQLQQEARRLQQAGALSAEETALLDFKGLAAFWSSDLGLKVRAQSQFVQRELQFTMRVSPGELAAITGETPASDLADDFVVVQGVADLAVIQPREIWLIDFKTDHLGPDSLGEKVKAYQPQLRLYAVALSRIYRRPVSSCWLYFLSRQTAVTVDTDPAENQ